MSTCLKRISIFLMLAVALPVTAEDITPLVNSARSFHLTTEEKALFVEASDRFKKYEIPKSINIRSVYWLDNEHLVFSSRKYPGWEAKPDEMSRVITYNVNTGAISDSGYRGLVKCLNHLGDILLAQSEKEYGDAVKLEDYRWLLGKWGQSLQQTDYSVHSFIPAHICRLVPYGDPIYRIPPENQPPGFAIIMPLLPEHGFLENTVVRKNGHIQDQLHLIKPDGQRLLIANTRLSRFSFAYLQWNETYFETAITPEVPRSFSPSGKITSPVVPSLLSVWSMTVYGHATGYATRIGMLWGVQQQSNYFRKQGIFLHTDKGLFRVEVGRHEGPIKISPNGCMVHAQVVRGDSSKAAPGSQIRVVINVCKELEQ
jgi:hypothetical protein